MTSAEPSPPRLPRNVWLLAWASLLNDTASEVLFSLAPAFLKSLGGSARHLGLMEGFADLVASLLKLQSGRWSDQLQSRRSFVAAGYLVTALFRPLAAVAMAPWHMIAIRLVDRTGKGLRSAPRDALLSESVSSGMRGWAFGLHRAMDHLGAALGPLLATIFLWYFPGKLRILFALTLIPGLLVLIAIALLREPVVRERAASDAPTSSRLPRRFVLFLAALALFGLGNSSDAFLLNRLLDLHLEERWLPAVWLGFHLLKSAGNLFVGSLVDRVGPRAPLVIGWILYAAVYCGFALTTSVPMSLGLFAVYAGFYALTEPSEKTLVTSLVPADQKGLAFGWFHFLIGLVSLPANVIFGYLYEASPLAAFGLGSSLALIAAAIVALGVRTSLDHEAKPT
jgi:MFS family permease